MRALAGILLLSLALAGAARAQDRGEPGRFDYWLLALSWSPAFCATAKQPPASQCGPGRRFGFVVHGLWPQYETGWPAFCAAPTPLPDPLVEDMLPIMPSRDLVAHQWKKHGTCAGSAAEDYFAATRDAYARLRIPAPLQAPQRPLSLTTAEIEAMFAAANPGLGGDMVAVTCRGRRLSEVRVCMDKDLNFRSCGRDLRDTCRAAVEVRPVR